jgi:ubiquinone/menaquinone biosynthesis C-methylase UbiE
MILDVGCGEHFHGDVNLDRYVNPTIHRNNHLRTKFIPNFVVGDAQHLPFKNDCFDKVVSNHVIEHLQKPMLMLQESCRVSKCFVVIRCPHRFNILTTNKSHIHRGFNQSWFRKAFEILGFIIVKDDVVFGYFGIPEEVRVKAKKGDLCKC